MAKRRRGFGIPRGERYALVPEEVMESVCYHAQPDWARTVLYALACRCNGHNNGDLSLPFSEAKRLGIAAQWKLYAGLRLLERADLIVCTRRGRLERGTKLASLYALTWRGINECDKVEFDAGITHCPIPSHAWAKWVKPNEWSDFVKHTSRINKGRKIPHTTHGGEGRSYQGGAMDPFIAPTRVEKETAVIAPTMVDTSKTQAGGAADAGREAAHPALDSLPNPLPTTGGQVQQLRRRQA